MRLDDRPRPPRVRLLRFRLVKCDLHRPTKYCIAAASSIALFAICNTLAIQGRNAVRSSGRKAGPEEKLQRIKVCWFLTSAVADRRPESTIPATAMKPPTARKGGGLCFFIQLSVADVKPKRPLQFSLSWTSVSSLFSPNFCLFASKDIASSETDLPSFSGEAKLLSV